MKNKLIYLSFLTVFICSNIVKAQDCTNDYWGSQTLYEPPVAPLTPSPEDYKPIFINYIGRNGAEHLLKDVSTSFVYNLLQKADSAHALKVDGNNLRKMLTMLQNVEKLKIDKISFAGIEEQRGIGFRMLSSYGNVFINRKCVVVSAIKEDRMNESAQALLSGVRHKLDEPGCDKTNYDDDDNLQAFTVSPSLIELVKHGDWKDNVDNIRDSKKPENFNTKFLTRFFEQKFFDGIPEADQNKFINDLYKMSTVIYSIRREIIGAGYTLAQLDIRSFFTCSELQLFNTLNSAEQFYKSGPGNDKAGIQVRASVPLLINFMNTTDAYSVSSNVAADFRITNAETMASFVALLGIKGASKESNDVNKFEKVWKANEVVPLSANLQLILYKGQSPDTQREYLVKFVFNEKEVSIVGLKSTAQFPYYKWDDVKAFYTKKLNDEWDVEKLDDNMHKYLLNLK
jgi:multiple inositol-polyphosphate phosphatase/2,3-bisphosphoglycerate 3-phosphatase